MMWRYQEKTNYYDDYMVKVWYCVAPYGRSCAIHRQQTQNRGNASPMSYLPGIHTLLMQMQMATTATGPQMPPSSLLPVTRVSVVNPKVNLSCFFLLS